MATLASPALLTTAASAAASGRTLARRTAASAPRRHLAPLRATGPDGEWISIRSTIEQKISDQLAPTVLIVNDDSEKHSLHKGGQHDGHAGVRSNESHFSVVVVSDAFAGMTPVKRHRMVNSILQEEFDAGLHAMQLSTKTPAEYEKSKSK